MSFDVVAPHYDWMEAVSAGSLLQRVRTHWLDDLGGCSHVLSVGEGHGRFAEAFVARHPQARLTCVDDSARMLARARRRLDASGGAGAVTWTRGTLPAWRPEPGAYDGLVTNCFLDCFPPDQLADVIATLADGAAPRATWLVADFAVPSHGPARWRAQAAHAAMYAFFRQVTRIPARRLTPPDPYLRQAGFRLAGRQTFSWGLLQADVWTR